MFRTTLRTGVIAILSLSLLGVCFAQSAQPRTKKPIKDFGSSLKRLKSNTPQPAPVEAATPAKTQSEEVDEGDVIRTDTSLVSSELLVLDSKGNYVLGLKA